MRATPTSSPTLAIDGGKPVRETLLPYAHQSIDEDDIRAVVDVLGSEWLTTGPKVEEFEEKCAAWVGAKHAVSFSSGTAALHGAAFAAGLRPGDEAITSPLTFVATANCVLYQGATPVFADVCPDTLNALVRRPGPFCPWRMPDIRQRWTPSWRSPRRMASP
jgi:dTDP-4-amino-4,6-dideoxygalactose transaminase